MNDMYDVVIIGAGPAGLTLLLYASMYGLRVLCIGDVIGGKVAIAPAIIDYPGLESITGKIYVQGLMQQVHAFSGKTETAEVGSVRQVDSAFEVKTTNNKQFETKIIVLATGNGNKQRENKGVKLAQSVGIGTQNGFITVNERFHTTVKNVYAIGDCAVYPYGVEQLVVASASGVKVACQIYEDLRGEKPPILWGQAKIPRRV